MVFKCRLNSYSVVVRSTGPETTVVEKQSATDSVQWQGCSCPHDHIASIRVNLEAEVLVLPGGGTSESRVGRLGTDCFA